MALSVFRFLAIVFAALALAPGMAHLLELPNKIKLPGQEYLVVQQIYQGWSLLGVVVIAALLSAAALAFFSRGHTRAFAWALVGLVCLAGTQIVFWTWTFPVNRATENWTVLPTSWEALRAQWEYSHAASAVLNLGALAALTVSALAPTR